LCWIVLSILKYSSYRSSVSTENQDIQTKPETNYKQTTVYWKNGT
jgi:hypothetical protein